MWSIGHDLIDAALRFSAAVLPTQQEQVRDLSG
jgi:hypothetical protein